MTDTGQTPMRATETPDGRNKSAHQRTPPIVEDSTKI